MCTATTVTAEYSLQPPQICPTATRVSSSIVRIYNAFLCHPDLNPSPAINSIFSELVELCIQPYDAQCVALIFNDKRISKLASPLRTICSTGEYKLEFHWATRILSGKTQSESKLPPLHQHQTPR
jgi:hypothetical protein